MKLALPRGFAISGLFSRSFTQGGALPESCLPWVTNMSSLRDWSLLLRRQEIGSGGLHGFEYYRIRQASNFLDIDRH
jgi:hypothetical protein